MNVGLDISLSTFAHVKRANTRHGLAPHKSILLLTWVELIEKGIVINNRFEVNVDLVGLFQENWRLLVRTIHQPDFTQPFYYLQSDKAAGNNFWHLYPNPGFQINTHIKSVKILSEVVAYGSFDDGLAVLLSNPLNRTVVRDHLLSVYFPDERLAYYRHKQLNDGFYHEVQSLVLNEPEARYKHISIQTEEDVFVRSGLFKRYIPKLYQDTFAMTGIIQYCWGIFMNVLCSEPGYHIVHNEECFIDKHILLRVAFDLRNPE